MFTLIYGYIVVTAIATVAITVMGINLERRAVERDRTARRLERAFLEAA